MSALTVRVNVPPFTASVQLFAVQRLVALTEQGHVTRVLDKSELYRLHDRPLGTFPFPRRHCVADNGMGPQVVEPLELGRTLGAAVGRLAGVDAQMNHEAVPLPKAGRAVAAAVARRFLRVSGLDVLLEVGLALVDRVAQITLYISLLA